MAKKITTIFIITLFLGTIGAQIAFGVIFHKVDLIPYDIGPELRSRDVTSFKPTNTFGILTAFAIVYALIADLLFLPALVMLFKPKR